MITEQQLTPAPTFRSVAHKAIWVGVTKSILYLEIAGEKEAADKLREHRDFIADMPLDAFTLKK